jgi:serine/threonine protein kinase
VCLTEYPICYPRKCQGYGIAQLHDYFHTPYVVAMLFELMQSDLQTYANQQPSRQLVLRDVYAVAIQLSRALSLLQVRGVLPRDVHMKNVLVSVGRPNTVLQWSRLVVVLTDFGWGTNSVSADVRAPAVLTGGAYITSYRPPEIFMTAGVRFDSKGVWYGPSHVAYGCASWS